MDYKSTPEAGIVDTSYTVIIGQPIMSGGNKWAFRNIDTDLLPDT